MNSLVYVKILPFLLVCIAIFSVDAYSMFPIGNTYVNWSVYSLFLLIVWKIKDNKESSKLLLCYFGWISICSIRGFAMASAYWEYKACIANTLALLMPCVIYLFSQLEISAYILKRSMIMLLLLLLVWFIPFCSHGAYHFFISLLIVFGIFFPLISNRYWKFILLVLLVIMCFVDFGARSQFIKALVSLSIGCCLWYFRSISMLFLKIMHVSFFIIPIILFFLGINEIFNPFQMDRYFNQWFGIKELKEIDDGREENLLADTRTLIYTEVLTSAMKNEYIWAGRTPARGNDSEVFGAYLSKKLGTGKKERFSNELCHLNIFTWTGIIGVVLFALLYWQASFRAMYYSNNKYIKILGLFVAFRWCYGWVEDRIQFDMNTLSIWTAIAICYSEEFRQMTDEEFVQWINKIFSFKRERIVIEKK